MNREMKLLCFAMSHQRRSYVFATNCLCQQWCNDVSQNEVFLLFASLFLFFQTFL